MCTGVGTRALLLLLKLKRMLSSSARLRVVYVVRLRIPGSIFEGRCMYRRTYSVQCSNAFRNCASNSVYSQDLPGYPWTIPYELSCMNSLLHLFSPLPSQDPTHLPNAPPTPHTPTYHPTTPPPTPHFRRSFITLICKYSWWESLLTAWRTTKHPHTG